jgi:hypothetical protein
LAVNELWAELLKPIPASLTDSQKAFLAAVAGGNLAPYRVLPDGETAVWVYHMTYGKGRLCIGWADDLTGWERGYCYESLTEAFAAADSWNGEGEPEGWFKNLQTGQYRKGWNDGNDSGAS